MDTEETSPGTFLELQDLIQQIEKTSSYNDKTKVIRAFLKDFEGDCYLLLRLLLCREEKRAYNLREKGFVAVLTTILPDADSKEMITDLEKGDIGETMRTVRYCQNSLLTFLVLCCPWKTSQKEHSDSQRCG
jgi:hypothetical protein